MKKQKKNQAAPRNRTAEAGPKKTGQTNVQIDEERIRQRAYELHQARGGAPGQELDDWLQAERELKAEMG